MNGWNNRDSLVNILTVVGSSQESRGFSHVRFKIYVSENVPKEYQVYCRELYYGHDINVLKSGNKKSPRYKKLKEMGVDDYSVLFKEELKDV